MRTTWSHWETLLLGQKDNRNEYLSHPSSFSMIFIHIPLKYLVKSLILNIWHLQVQGSKLPVFGWDEPRRCPHGLNGKTVSQQHTQGVSVIKSVCIKNHKRKTKCIFQQWHAELTGTLPTHTWAQALQSEHSKQTHCQQAGLTIRLRRLPLSPFIVFAVFS